MAFPPETRELQFDEKWAFVGKKEKHCDPDDPEDQWQGDHWDQMGYDPEHRLVLGVVPGKRTAENVRQLVEDLKQRTGGCVPDLITTDEYPAYETAILEAYGETVVPQRTGKRGRPKNAYKVPPKDLNYAPVHKTREKGRVVKIDFRVIFGTVATVMAALARSAVSQAINTAFVEPHSIEPTETARRGRCERDPVFRRTGKCIKPSPTSPCTATTSAGPCEPCADKDPTATGNSELQPWPPA